MFGCTGERITIKINYQCNSIRNAYKILVVKGSNQLEELNIDGKVMLK
jgi:hypothetical protein